MANPFAIAAALARQQTVITCPRCGFKKQVLKKPASHRVCPKCRKQFADPLSVKARKK